MQSMQHYVKKIIQLGPYATARVIHNRVKDKLFNRYWRALALQKKAAHSWAGIARMHRLPQLPTFLMQAKERAFISVNALCIDVHSVDLCAQADAYTRNCFDLLGSGQQCFTKIPWHSDFRLHAQHPNADHLFDKNQYYKDIIITPGTGAIPAKDIKVPWELGRLQHLFVVGYAYEQTQRAQYAQTFVDHFTDWYEQNPYLLGANWVCPMDVGLRALNCVWAFHFFKDCTEISESFWQRFVGSMYDHFYYLENNWELYDSRTSNHYLSDLVGYFYLCWFFQDLPGVEQKTNWCFQEIRAEFDKQVYSEGTDYEGSTRYHGLVTELFYHWYILSKQLGFVISTEREQKLQRMFVFIDWCTPVNGTCIQIGDNDSGSVLAYGITPALIARMCTAQEHDESVKEQANIIPVMVSDFCEAKIVSNYPSFGLSILKNNQWHITLRHHAYNAAQPSGHFHNDVASVTLAFNGIPIFVDPGSYLYTPSVQWRNHFRSVKVHNTSYLNNAEPVQLDERLFYVQLPEQLCSINNVDGLYTQHALYGVRFTRAITLRDDDAIIIADSWNAPRANAQDVCYWNFTLGPDITAHAITGGVELLYKNSALVHMQSNLVFEIVHDYVSLTYGTKISAQRLCAKMPLDQVMRVHAICTIAKII